MCPRERTYSAVGVSEAIDIFEKHDFSSSPLFLRLSLDRPHTPVSSPKPYDTMYADQACLPDFPPFEKAAQLPLLKAFIRAREWDKFTDDEILKVRYYYYGLVTHLDYELGRLLDVVENSSQQDRTIVVLSADHGCMLGEHGLYVKCPHYYTETARVPFILSWPGVLPSAARIKGLVEMVDLLPTLCELSDISIPSGASGRSLLPVLHAQESGREDVFAEQGHEGSGLHWVAIRTERYSYTHYLNTDEKMLFDLTNDPHEQDNLMLCNPSPELVEDLEKHISDRRKQ